MELVFVSSETRLEEGMTDVDVDLSSVSVGDSNGLTLLKEPTFLQKINLFTQLDRQSTTNFVIVPVFVLFYWRGTWLLCDAYFPVDTKISGWWSIVIGYGGLVILAVYEWLYGSIFCKSSPSTTTQFDPFMKSLVSRTRTYIVGFLVVNSWRGLWLLQEVYLYPSHPIASAWISHGIGTAVLVLFLHLQSILAPPVLLAPDNDLSFSDYSCCVKHKV